ncbi:hypothetical protein FI667_g4563, partial [Globisporangium splendens]
MTMMSIRKQSTLLLVLLVGVALLAMMTRMESGGGVRAAYAGGDDDDDDDDEDEADEFDFFSNNLDFVTTRHGDTAAADCEGQQCPAADGVTHATIPSVLKRGLVTKKPQVQDILKVPQDTHVYGANEHVRFATDVSTKAFGGETLGYVTPWNSRGYDFAKLFRAKFTYISPVWLQIREDGKTHTPVVTGTHDIDAQWIRAVRGEDGHDPKIVPRVVYERNKLASTDVPLIITQLLDLAEKHAFDGFVFEIPVVEGTMDLLLRMGDAFQDAKKLLLLVLNRSTKGLLPLVHRFSMNAYDYQTPGPNAPFLWLQTTLDALTDAEKEKILLGVPFYGYDNTDAVTGPSYINTLKNEDVKKIRWDANAHECHHEYYSNAGGDHHVTFFPCLQFLYDRLQLYEQNGVGAAIWELGQGLDYFYDLL